MPVVQGSEKSFIFLTFEKRSGLHLSRCRYLCKMFRLILGMKKKPYFLKKKGKYFGRKEAMSRSKSWGKKSSQGGRREVRRLERWVPVCSSLYQCPRGGGRRWKLKWIKCIERRWQRLLLLFYRWEKGTFRFIIQDHPAKHVGAYLKAQFWSKWDTRAWVLICSLISVTWDKLWTFEHFSFFTCKMGIAPPTL